MKKAYCEYCKYFRVFKKRKKLYFYCILGNVYDLNCKYFKKSNSPIKVCKSLFIKLWHHYLSYIFKKKALFRKMNKFENWVYYKFIAEDFHDFVERNT